MAFRPLLGITIGLCLLMLLLQPQRLPKLLTGLWRLKWLILSLMILFGWFTPGEPVISATTLNLPSREGLWMGLQRALVLVALIAAVLLLITGRPAAELVSALRQLLSPLGLLGFDTRSFANRAGLCLDSVASIEGKLRRQKDSSLSRQQAGIQLAVDLITDIEKSAVQSASNGAAETFASDAEQARRRDWLLLLLSLLIIAGITALL